MISVIISNFNGHRFLPKLLASLRGQRGVTTELIVVDRRSTDGSVEYLAAQPDVRVLTEPPETGLVCGYQAGTAVATGELYFFCNEDMWFAPDCLQRLAERIDLPNRIAAADGWHRNYDDTEWRHRGVRFRRLAWAINSAHPRYETEFEADLPAGAEIPYPCAGALLIQRDVFHELGGWDRDFFLDLEDVDLFLRAWQRDWRSVTVPEARIHHAVNASVTHRIAALRTTVARRRYVSQRASMTIVAVKYFGWPVILLGLLHWPIVLMKNLFAGRWQHVAGDFAWWPEMKRRLPAAWRFRRANHSWNHHHPGERFFADPRFRI